MMMTLRQFLQQKHSHSTVKIYLFEINHYIEKLGATRAEQAGYKEVVSYLSRLRDHYDNPGTINRILCAIRQYYFYLITIEKRNTHPCRYLSINDKINTDIQIQDLLKPSELQLLLQRKERYEILTIRNKVVMSLLVNQALTTREMTALKTTDIHLEKGEISIRPTTKSNGRTLSLKPDQVMLLHDYLGRIRPELVKQKTDKLIITKVGTAEQGEGIHYLVSTFRKLFPNKKLTPTTIRQSVIANLLKEGHDLRIVQVFAGHKTTSTTEKYRQTNLEKLKQSVDKHHPLAQANPNVKT